MYVLTRGVYVPLMAVTRDCSRLYSISGQVYGENMSRVHPHLQRSSGNVGFVVGKVALWQVYQFSLHRLLHTHHHGTTDPTVAHAPSGLSLTPPQESKNSISGMVSLSVCLK
jgi:hypothetical protein